MAQTNIAKTFMFAELDYKCAEKDEQRCEACHDRFRCWTSRSPVLQILHYTMTRNTSMRDEFEFEAELPNCFRGGNMVGSKVRGHMERDNTMQILNGIVTAQTITADNADQMKITLRGIGIF